MENIYVHFPFCRSKCSYCTLYSRCGVSEEARAEYAAKISREISSLVATERSMVSTVYFGGGSPALCDLGGVMAAVCPLLAADYEFTIELHPNDVDINLLSKLRDGGVNRISMGLQSLDDQVLADMGRGYTVVEAYRAFELIRRYFDNAGVDLIVGYDRNEDIQRFSTLKDCGVSHVSVYSLQNERGIVAAPDDDVALNRIREAEKVLLDIGLQRYEISNYARPGYECRHNLAVWRGEDYRGIGEGACGRVGLKRTRGVRNGGGFSYQEEVVDEPTDRKERAIFRLRTRDGIDTNCFPEWAPILRRFVAEKLLSEVDGRFVLTARGTEVCDTILAELV